MHVGIVEDRELKLNQGGVNFSDMLLIERFMKISHLDYS
jgi:hypothetical protein